MIFFGGLVFLVLAIRFYLNWIFSYWSRRGVKSLKNTSYIFGNVTDVVFQRVPVYSTYKQIYEECVAQKERFMGYYYLVKPGLVAVDPDFINSILKTDFNYFTDRPFYLNKKVDPLSEHLVSAGGARWKKMRDQLSPAFTPSKLKIMFQTLQQVGDQLLKVLDDTVKNGQTLNLKDVSSKYIMDAIGACIFGIDCNTLDNQNLEFKHCTSQILGGSTSQNLKLAVSLLNPAILDFFRIPLNSKEASDFCLNLTKSTIETREKHNIIRRDLMHLLIQLRNNVNIEEEGNFEELKGSGGQKALDIQEIASQALIFFGAAYETSSQTISFLVSHVILNKDIEDKLRNEILSVLAKHGGKVTYDVIAEMTYLDMCLKETLRKYPGAAVVARVCTKDYKVPDSNLTIEKGTIIYVPVMELHHDSRYYPDPQTFDPERFSPENSENNSTIFFPMGDGPRICIGARLATMKIKLFIILLFSNYKFSISPKTKLPLTLNQHSIILTLNELIHLDIEKL